MIVGSGIAGTTLAYELEKRNIDYMICTDQTNPLNTTTSLAFGHCRVPDPSKLDDIIKLSVEQLGESKEKMG